MEFCKPKLRLALNPLVAGAALLATPVALSDSACSPASPDLSPPLVVGLASSPTQLDPRLAIDATSDKLCNLLFDGLLRRDLEGQLQLSLAQKLEQPSPTVYLVTLRHDRIFHDESPVTVQDVVYTFQSMLDPALGSIKRSSLARLRDISSPAPWQVRLELSEPDAPFLEMLTTGIVPAARARNLETFARQPIGSGPYRFRSYARDEILRLERAAPPLDPNLPARLHFRILPDATVRALELIHGGIDLLQNDLPVPLVGALAQREGIQRVTRPSTLTKYLAFNARDPALADRRVRQALVMALDREEVIRYRYKGLASPASSILSPSSFAYAPDVPVYPFDPVRAAALLDEAGLPDPAGPKPRLELHYQTSMDAVAVGVARVFAAQLARVGVKVVIETSEFGTFFDAIKRGDFQIYSLTAVGVNDPDYLSYLMHSSRIPPHGANRAFALNPSLDRWLDDARRSLEPQSRARLYRQVQHQAYHDAIYVPLWYEHHVALMKSTLEGYVLTPTGDFQALDRVRRRRAPGD